MEARVLQKTVQAPSVAAHGSAEDSMVVSGARAEAKADLDKLAYSVSVAETSNCTRGSGLSKNNCIGIMEWPNGVRQLKWYNTKQESLEDFKRIWKNYYGGRFPTLADAHKWTGSDRAETWLSIVTEKYYEH